MTVVTGGELVALAGLGVAGLSALAAPLSGVYTRRHERALARGDRMYVVRSEVYEAMLVQMRTRAIAFEQMYPMATFGNEPKAPDGLDERETIRLEARVGAFGSEPVLAALKRTGDAMRAVQGRALTMAAIEAQGGSVVGTPYMEIEADRKVMRARVDELEAAVRSDLDSL